MFENQTSYQCRFTNRIKGSKLSRDCFTEKCVLSLFEKDDYNWMNIESFASEDITVEPDQQFSIVIIGQSRAVYGRYLCEISSGNKTIKGYTDLFPDGIPKTQKNSPTILLNSSLFIPDMEKEVYLEVLNHSKIKIMPINWTYWLD